MRELFTIVDKNLFSHPQVKRVVLSSWNFTYVLLKVFRFEAFVNRITGKSFTNKSTSRCDFIWEIFYRLLSAINSNVDFYWFSMDNKTFMQSLGINILIDAYWQLTPMLILSSILLIFNIIWTIKHSCRVQG